MKHLIIALAFSLSANAQQLKLDTLRHEININIAQYKQQQMTGLALQLFAVATFYGMQQAQTQQQHDIAFVFGAASMYFGTIIRIGAFDRLNVNERKRYK